EIRIGLPSRWSCPTGLAIGQLKQRSADRRVMDKLAVKLAVEFEGLRLEPYHDPVGFPTVGYGHLLSRTPWEGLEKFSAVTPAEALDLLAVDLARAERSVARLCPVALTANQAAALTDFVFNCGGGNLQASTLRQCVLRGEHGEAADQLLR